jgi:hypothetical protein
MSNKPKCKPKPDGPSNQLATKQVKARETLTTFFSSIVNHPGSSIVGFEVEKSNTAVKLTLADGRWVTFIDGTVMVNLLEGALGQSIDLCDDPSPRIWRSFPKERNSDPWVTSDEEGDNTGFLDIGPEGRTEEFNTVEEIKDLLYRLGEDAPPRGTPEHERYWLKIADAFALCATDTRKILEGLPKQDDREQ